MGSDLERWYAELEAQNVRLYFEMRHGSVHAQLAVASQALVEARRELHDGTATEGAAAALLRAHDILKQVQGLKGSHGPDAQWPLDEA